MAVPGVEKKASVEKGGVGEIDFAKLTVVTEAFRAQRLCHKGKWLHQMTEGWKREGSCWGFPSSSGCLLVIFPLLDLANERMFLNSAFKECGI